ncbi:MAG: lipoprotein [Oscillospiraceae bacterium]
MKKLLSAALAAVMILSLAACGRTMKTTDDLIKKARKEIPISDADTIDIVYAGKCQNGSYSLLWFISGNEFQAHYYLAIECLEANGSYEFEQTFKPLNREKDIAILQWQRGYAFLINNTECKTLRITDINGIHDIAIEEGAYPYIWYSEIIPSEYKFLDAEGSEIV